MKNNIKHYSRIWIAICSMILVIVYFIGYAYFPVRNDVPQLCTEKKCFTVELARTSAQQESGLMDRTGMAENNGMLFIFPISNLYVFRMKNTLIPLDMLWIDEQFKVVRILTAKPCIADPCMNYNPQTWAKYVLEINAGIAAKYWIVEWTVIKFRNIK